MSVFKTQEEYNRFKESVREFVLTECEEIAERIEDTGKLPVKEVLLKLSEKNLLKLTLPEKYGGMGLSFSEYWPILADVAMTHHSIRMLVHGQNTGVWRLIDDIGTEKQKSEYIPKISNGDILLGFALTEPEAGTGKDIKTIAVKKGDSYVLNGKKHLISFADVADVFGVIAATDKNAGEEGISSFLVPRGTKGLSIRKMPDTMGVKGSIHGVLILEDCEVPSENILGREGIGLQGAFGFLEISRVGIATSCLGVAQRSLDLSIEFAKKRVTFGKPTAQRQAVQQMLADMATYIHALRMMIADAGRKFDEGRPIPREASMCKLFGIETVRRVTDNALLIHGGIGYTREYPIERLYRDARAMWFEEGTPHIQRLVIARDLLRN